MKADVSVDEKKLKDTVLNDEQKQAVEAGGKADIRLNMADASKTVTDKDKKLIASVMVTDEQLGMFLDLSVLLTVTDKDGNIITDKELIPQTSTKFSVNVKLADELLLKDSSKVRTYQVIRVHDGKPEIIPSKWDASAGVLTFETDKFSTYAVTYSDVDKETVKDQDKDPESKGDTAGQNNNVSNTNNAGVTAKPVLKTGDDNRLFLMAAIFCFAIVMVIVGVRMLVRKK